MSDYQPGDVIRYESPDGSGIGLVESVARDGDIHLKFSRVVLHAHEDDHDLLLRTEDPDMGKDELIHRVQSAEDIDL